MLQGGGGKGNQDQFNNDDDTTTQKSVEMSAAIMQQPLLRRSHEETSGRLPPLSSMLPPLPPFNPRSMAHPRKSTSPEERFTRSPYREESSGRFSANSEEGNQRSTLPSFVGSGETKQSESKMFAFGVHSSTSPPMSAKTRIGSDAYSMEDASTVSSSSSLRAPSQHVYRSRTRSSAMPYDVGMPSPTVMDIFNQMWDVMLDVRRCYDRFQSNSPNAGPRPLPSIRDGEVPTLMSQLQYEIDLLAEHDARVADHFALDVRHLHDQYVNQTQQARVRGSSTANVPYRRERSSYPTQTSSRPFHASSSLSPPMYTISAPRSRQLTPSSSSVNERSYNAAPASAPAYGRGQEGYQHHSAYDQYRAEQASMPDRKVNVGYGGSSVYENRVGIHASSAPPSPQESFRPSTNGGHLPGSFYHSMSARTPPSMPRRVRKRRDEAEQSCLSCSAKETPEWRKGPTGPRTLCNACGLLFAKQCRKREMELQARGKRPKGSRVIGPEEMTQEERENSLLELQMAVQARVSQSLSNISGLPMVSSTLSSPGIGSNGHSSGYQHHQHHYPNHPQQHQPFQHNKGHSSRSPPSSVIGAAGHHHIGMQRTMPDQSHSPSSPPSLPPLLRQ